MLDEIKLIHDNHTYNLVKLLEGKRTMESKWSYLAKHEKISISPRYETKLMMKGFHQRKDVNFNEIFSPVVKMSSIRIVLNLIVILDLEVE